MGSLTLSPRYATEQPAKALGRRGGRLGWPSATVIPSLDSLANTLSRMPGVRARRPIQGPSDGDGDRGLGAHYRPVQGVAFDGFTTGFANQADEFLPAHALRGGGASVVVDLLFNHRSVEIIGAEAQGDLRDLWRQHLPVGFDVREVVEDQAAHRDLF